MSNRAPNNAPKTAPKIKSASNNTPPEWKDHWITKYHEPRIVWYRQKYAIAVTKPSELRKPTDPDKKLSARTTDKKIAEERKWEIAAKIYTGFDEALKDVDPQVARSATFRQKAIQLLARNGIRHPSIAKAFTSDWFELDDLIRLINRFGIDIPGDMLELIDDEAKYFVTHLPTLVEKTEVDEAAELLWGTKEFDTDEALNDMRSITTKLLDTQDAANAGILTLALQSLSIELEKHNPSAFSDRDRELSSRIKTNQSTQTSSKIKEVRQRYLSENRWNRNRTKTGAALAIQRFCDLHGGDEDIANFNAKHAYEFAQWMDHELNSANKSIKAALSYIKGMFTWAITQKQYSITEEPWGTLHRIGTYGKEEESYKPFKRQQLLQLFQLTKTTSTGRMNPREHLLLSILITTGCRLDEAALLCWDNVVQHEAGWHYIDLTKSLVKNSGSMRLLPIPDCLWPLFPERDQQLTVNGKTKSPDGRLFDYSLDADGKAARAASQACGRQLNKIDKEPKQVTHSLRGNLKDLLRDAGISKELNNYITGHGQGDVAGDRYGAGHSVEVRHEALNQIEHPWIQTYPLTNSQAKV